MTYTMVSPQARSKWSVSQVRNLTHTYLTLIGGSSITFVSQTRVCQFAVLYKLCTQHAKNSQLAIFNSRYQQ